MDIVYSQLFDEIPCFVTAQDRRLHIIASNRMFRENFGDSIGSYCYEIYKGRKEKCTVCPVEMTFKDGEIHHSEEIVKSSSGEEISVIVYSSPIRDTSGDITSVLEISTDVTQIKRLQHKFQTLFDESPCYISVQGRDLKILEANRRFKDDFGEGVGEDCFRVYKHRTEPCGTCPVASTFQDGQIHNSEEVVTTREGKHVDVLCYTAPIRDEAGKIVSVMEMSTNITEVRELQSQLTSLGLLLGSVSHGIKGALNGLDGGIYLAETGLAKDNEKRFGEGWEMIKRNADGIRNMVLNVLYYSKERDVEWQKVDLFEIVTSVCNSLANKAKNHKIDLTVEADRGFFECDRQAIHSLLLNLTENAIEACRTDTTKSDYETSVSAYFEEDNVIFDIKDNGIGMDQETREKAFTLFFSSKGAKGTGLGLFIAHNIVEKHCGTISLDSDFGTGTRIIVKLPRQKSSILGKTISS